MKLKRLIVVGAALILGGCNSQAEIKNCLGVTETNIIEVQNLMDSVDSYFDTLTPGKLTESTFFSASDSVLEAIQNVDLVVNTDEDQEFKNSYLDFSGLVLEIIDSYLQYYDYGNQEDKEKAQAAIISLAGFNLKFKNLKQSCE